MVGDGLTLDSELLRTRLRHVRWIGGGSGAGKSSIAHRLVAANGLIEFSGDDTIPDHSRRANRAETPLLQTFLAMDMNERWVTRAPRTMFQTFPWFHGEGFGLILDDLLALPESRPILAEGFRLLPRLVAPLLSQPNQAVWLIPTKELRRRTFLARGPQWFPYETEDPQRALVNLLRRDRIFADHVAEEAAELNLRVLKINGTMSIEAITRRVGRSLGLGTR